MSIHSALPEQYFDNTFLSMRRREDPGRRTPFVLGIYVKRFHREEHSDDVVMAVPSSPRTC